MAIPAGMITRTIETAPICDALGKPIAGAKATLISERSPVWSANGQIFLATPLEATTDPLGVARWTNVPIPSQDGWMDGAGALIRDWTLTASVATPPRAPDLPDSTFLLDEGADAHRVVFDVSDLRSAGVVATVTDDTAVRAEAAATAAAATLASATPGLAGGLAKLDLDGDVVNAFGQKIRPGGKVVTASSLGVLPGVASGMTTILNNAMAALASTDPSVTTIIEFEPGVYYLVSLALKPGVYLKSQYKHAATMFKAGTTAALLIDAKGANRTGVSDFTLDLGPRLFNDTKPGGDATSYSASSSLRFTDCSRVRLDGNRVLRGSHTLSLQNAATGTSSSNGILGCSDFDVYDNYFEGDHRDAAIEVLPALVVSNVKVGNSAKRIRFRRNTVDSVSKHVGAYWCGIYTSEVSDLLIEDNTVLYSADTAFMVNNATRYVVTGNTGYGRQIGLYAGASVYGRVTENFFTSEADISIGLHARDEAGEPYMAFTLIMGNILPSSGRNAIAIEGTQYVTVVGNIISNWGTNAPLAPVDLNTTITTTPGLVSQTGATTLTNVGATSAWWGLTSTIPTEDDGSNRIYPGGSLATSTPSGPRGPIYMVTKTGTTTINATYSANYRSAIEAHGIGGHKPEHIIINSNSITKGANTKTGLIGIRVVDSPKSIYVRSNDVDNQLYLESGSAQFEYGVLSIDYDVQQGTVDPRSTYRTRPAEFKDLKTPTALGGAITRGSDGKLYAGLSDGWHEIQVAASPSVPTS